MIEYVDLPSSTAALSWAREAQAAGRFDLFRGQPRCWPIRSTLYRRLDDAALRDGLTRLQAFSTWLGGEALLAPRVSGLPDIVAIAQHYGLATPYVDVTTDPAVAQFFALDGHTAAGPAVTPPNRRPLAFLRRRRHGGSACLIALDEASVRRRVEAVPPLPGADASLGRGVLRLAVDNFWRLEAQAGCFLVDDGLVDELDATVLVFPVAAGETPEYPRERVYPVEQSDLELTVEQYLQHERLSTASRTVMAEFDDQPVLHVRSDEIGRRGVRLPPVVGSWPTAEPPVTAHYAQVRRDGAVTLELPSDVDRDTWLHAVAAQRPAGDALTVLRGRSASFRVLAAGAERPRLAAALERQWDAIRAEPHTDAQVWRSIAATTLLDALGRGAVPLERRASGEFRSSYAEEADVARAAYGGDLEVELTSGVGYGRARVGAAALRACLRTDVHDYVPREVFVHALARHDVDDLDDLEDAALMAEMIGAVRRPSLLFEFDPFAELYVEQVVPFAVVCRPRDPLFSVLRLHRFSEP